MCVVIIVDVVVVVIDTTRGIESPISHSTLMYHVNRAAAPIASRTKERYEGKYSNNMKGIQARIYLPALQAEKATPGKMAFVFNVRR